jgi:predicted TIM-barrel fold metal-dependent hydrolase
VSEINFQRDSMLRVHRTDISTPRFPAVDAHNHLSSVVPGEDETNVPRLLRAMDSVGIRTIVNLDGFWGEHLKKALAKYADPYPDRFVVFGSIDLGQIDAVDFGARIGDSMARFKQRGLRGIKFFKDLSLSHRDSSGALVLPSIPLFANVAAEGLKHYHPFGTGTPILPDDDRLRPVWENAAKLGLPVLIHIADPSALFQPPDEKNELYELLRRRPQWTYYGKDLPTFEQLLDAQLNMLRRNPDTTFILAHVGSYAENLAWVSSMLREHRNAYVDIAARVFELGRQPYTAREFFLRYQDRILFGTDRYPKPGEEYLPPDGLGAIYRFLETNDEYFTPDLPGICSWRLYGIGLPEKVLRKVYCGNAMKIIPGLNGRR